MLPMAEAIVTATTTYSSNVLVSILYYIVSYLTTSLSYIICLYANIYLYTCLHLMRSQAKSYLL